MIKYISTQSQFDRLPKSFREYTYIYIQDTKEIIYVNVARENSYVEAWGNSHVEAWGNSHVVAWGNSHVVAWGNSHVEAWGNSVNYVYSLNVHITIASFAVVFLFEKTKHLIKNSRTCTIIIPKIKNGLLGWLDNNAVKKEKYITLYKRVSKDFKTQEETRNETLWEIGTTPLVPNWNPKDNECGEGKFHACSRAYFCDEFRSLEDDRYIAVKINIKDLYAWPNPDYPYKIAFRSGKVVYECDRYGNKI